jgi:hypothetical protein
LALRCACLWSTWLAPVVTTPAAATSPPMSPFATLIALRTPATLRILAALRTTACLPGGLVFAGLV